MLANPNPSPNPNQVLAKLRGQKADDVSILKELDFMQMGQVRKEMQIPG